MTTADYVVVLESNFIVVPVKGRVAPVEAKRAGVGESPDRKREVKRTLEAAVEAGRKAGG